MKEIRHVPALIAPGLILMLLAGCAALAGEPGCGEGARRPVNLHGSVLGHGRQTTVPATAPPAPNMQTATGDVVP